MTQLKGYIYRNPARVYAFAFALAAFVARLCPQIPTEAVVVVLLAFLGVGDRVQKVENMKTMKALYTEPPQE